MRCNHRRAERRDPNHAAGQVVQEGPSAHEFAEQRRGYGPDPSEWEDEFDCHGREVAAWHVEQRNAEGGRRGGGNERAVGAEGGAAPAGRRERCERGPGGDGSERCKSGCKTTGRPQCRAPGEQRERHDAGERSERGGGFVVAHEEAGGHSGDHDPGQTWQQERGDCGSGGPERGDRPAGGDGNGGGRAASAERAQ